MRIASMAAIKAKFSTYIKETQKGPVVVTKNGKPIAVLLGIQDEDDIERLMMAHSPKLRAILDKSWKSIQQGRGIKAEKFWKDLDVER
jgi:prevent-host-death family protein